jgi:shikimate kinase
MNLKLKRTPGIYLAGFMGSGKSTVGRLLADRLGWHFVDLDEEIEEAEGMPIEEIFETRGEPEFRRIESEAIRAWVRKIESGQAVVMALGGGAFVAEDNRTLLMNNGITMWLDCPFELIRRRIASQSHRPLARDPVKFAELYKSRREAYALADYRIAVEGDDPVGPLEAILALPLFR